MQRIPIKSLKKDLAAIFAKAHKGHVFQVTKHEKPYVVISAPQEQHLRRGAKVASDSNLRRHFGLSVGPFRREAGV